MNWAKPFPPSQSEDLKTNCTNFSSLTPIDLAVNRFDSFQKTNKKPKIAVSTIQYISFQSRTGKQSHQVIQLIMD